MDTFRPLMIYWVPCKESTSGAPCDTTDISRKVARWFAVFFPHILKMIVNINNGGQEETIKGGFRECVLTAQAILGYSSGTQGATEVIHYHGRND